MDRPIVTLTTDWGEGGFFVGKVKGELYRLMGNVEVVDISHQLEPFNIMTATFVVRHACLGFPASTIHIIDVATRLPLLCIKAFGQYYLCCDNGLPSMVFGENIEEVALLQLDENGHYNFAACNIFARAAAMLARGASVSDLGDPPDTMAKRTLPAYVSQNGDYRIYIHYIDRYGNAYLGMSYREFEELRAGRPFTLTVRDSVVSELSNSYHPQTAAAQDRRNRLRLVISSTGLLELAVSDGSLAQLIGLKVNESVLLKFK